MKFIKIISFLFLLILFLSVIMTVTAQEEIVEETQETPGQSNTILQGKNDFTTSETFRPIYVKDFMLRHPEIEVISYQRNDITIGYINFLGGIGENFVIMPEETFEIISKEEIILEAS